MGFLWQKKIVLGGENHDINAEPGGWLRSGDADRPLAAIQAREEDLVGSGAAMPGKMLPHLYSMAWAW